MASLLPIMPFRQKKLVPIPLEGLLALQSRLPSRNYTREKEKRVCKQCFSVLTNFGRKFCLGLLICLFQCAYQTVTFSRSHLGQSHAWQRCFTVTKKKKEQFAGFVQLLCGSTPTHSCYLGVCLSSTSGDARRNTHFLTSHHKWPAELGVPFCSHWKWLTWQPLG